MKKYNLDTVDLWHPYVCVGKSFGLNHLDLYVGTSKTRIVVLIQSSSLDTFLTHCCALARLTSIKSLIPC